MVFFGLADDEEYADYAEYEESDPRYGVGTYGAQAVHAYDSRGNAVVHALPRDDSGLLLPPEPAPVTSSAVRTLPSQPSQRLNLLAPTDFTQGAKEIGDRFKAQSPVIMNLAHVDKQVAKRLLDFASGLAYGLSGRMQKVGEGVFLLVPAGMEISAEEKRRLRETGVLFDGFDT
jgi:cell division inhibitor SepF